LCLLGVIALAPALLGRLRRFRTMIDALFNQTNYVAAKSMLDATVLRQQAIASNIANVETPGYQRLQVAKSFEAEFERAIGSKDLDSLRGLQPKLEVDQTAVASKRDGNTVRIEDELLALSTNHMEHSLETQLVSGVLLKIRMAITGKA
jgi:flagellar basal-body rod protein FlgB